MFFNSVKKNIVEKLYNTTSKLESGREQRTITCQLQRKPYHCLYPIFHDIQQIKWKLFMLKPCFLISFTFKCHFLSSLSYFIFLSSLIAIPRQLCSWFRPLKNHHYYVSKLLFHWNLHKKHFGFDKRIFFFGIVRSWQGKAPSNLKQINMSILIP